VRRIRHPEPVRTIHAAVASRAWGHPAVRTLLEAMRAATAKVA
ncbi:MAG TPA: LysR family transcriptional regulator, partial [Amycolatopsis sp.]|nr:LysR family transcriptional regulator [Amycolatopsis sp.]